MENYLVQQTRIEKRRGLPEAGPSNPAREHASAHAQLRVGPFHLSSGGGKQEAAYRFPIFSFKKKTSLLAVP